MKEIDQLIAAYQPTAAAASLVADTPFVLLVGITGAGKDTIKNELLKDNRFNKIVTSTTRFPRQNNGTIEQHGQDYNFISFNEALDNIKNHQYFEVAKVHDRINGCTVEEIKRLRGTGKVAVGDVDYQGAAYYKKYAPQAVLIFVVPPSYDEWLRRIRLRYASEKEFAEALPERLKSAVRELTHALETDLYHVIVNDDINVAVGAVINIIADSNNKTSKDDAARLVAKKLLSNIADQLRYL